MTLASRSAGQGAKETLARETLVRETLVQETLVDGEYPLTRADFRDIADMLYADARIHLTESKATLVYSRLVKRLRALDLESFQDYRELLRAEEGGEERQEMLSALTTNVTRFFREKHHFDHLETIVLPPLLARARQGGRVRLWSAASSTGEEPYSIALTILKLEPRAAEMDIRVLATDIDTRVIAFGRNGVYPGAAFEGIPGQALQRYFPKDPAGDAGRRRAGDELRRIVAFRRLNLNSDWPMRGSFDAIFCRNVVIYFDDRTQQALWAKFAAKLPPNGWLYVGHSERIDGSASACFDSAGVTSYRRNQRRAG